MEQETNEENAVGRVDHLLNELERLAHSDVSPICFYREILARLKIVLNAIDCCVVARISPNLWCSVATTNPLFSSEATTRLTQFTLEKPDKLPRQWLESKEDGKLVGCSVRDDNWSIGGLVAILPLPLVAPFHAELLSAISEIVDTYQSKHGFTPSIRSRTEMRSVVRSILSSDNARDATQTLVNGARCLIDADRVSLVKAKKIESETKTETVAISGLANIDPHSEIVQAMNRIVLDAGPVPVSDVQLTQLAKSTATLVALALPVVSTSDPSQATVLADENHVLVIEWADMDRYASNVGKVEASLPWLTDAWRYHCQPTSQRAQSSRTARWWIGAACLLVLGVYFFLPTELMILSEGTLQPSVQRFVFSPAEGYVDKIYVGDGQQVEPGELVVTLSSPTLQMQINQMEAEIGLVEQKRVGINLTINQLRPTDEQSSLAVSRLAGEVQELEAKLASLIAQKRILDREQDCMLLRSPIHGTVLAWEIENYLENRPVRRGDPLLRIAALEERWRVDAAIVDWESGYVVEANRVRREADEPFAVEFVLASTTNQRLRGKIASIRNSMSEIDGYQRLEVTIEPDLPMDSPRLGTTVSVSIPCGQFPRWFVWTRSVLDAARRRFLL